jgi:ribosomal protein L22
MSPEEKKPARSRKKKADAAPTAAEVEQPASEKAAASQPQGDAEPVEVDKSETAKAEEDATEKATESQPAAGGPEKAAKSEAKKPARAKKPAKVPASEAAEKAEKAEKPAKKKDEKKDEKAEAKPARKRDQPRSQRQPGEPAVTVRAQARYVRTSARKARLVCDHIRGKDVEQARAILSFTPRGAAKPWLKLLESAIANAEHNHELVGDELKISSIHADEGPTLKRYRPRAMGRATRIRKRTSHLTITLTPKE